MTFTPVLRDRTLPHQIMFMHNAGDTDGLQVRVGCNCGWRSDRSIVSNDDAWVMYRAHHESA